MHFLCHCLWRALEFLTILVILEFTLIGEQDVSRVLSRGLTSRPDMRIMRRGVTPDGGNGGRSMEAPPHLLSSL